MAVSRPKTITQAAESGSARDLLVAMRARIATAVEDPETPARDLASLSKRLMEIAREIDALDAQTKQEASRGNHAVDGTFRLEAV